MPDSDSSPPVPESLDFFELVWQQEDGCQHFTDEQLPRMGVKGIECLRNLGTALSFLDRVSACWWNCPGGEYKEHTIQYVAGRACNLARAAVRLTRFGFYDEALNLVRSMGEIANLLVLFKVDPTAFPNWRDSDHSTRIKEFGPSKVRDRVLSAGGTLPMHKAKYGLLCELATHPIPDMRPQSYNQHGLVVSGGTFQEGAVLMLLNEIGAMTAVTLIFCALLAKVPSEHLTRIKEVAYELAKSLGGISVTNLSEAFAASPK